MRVFLDANILFSAAKSDGAVRALVRLLVEHGILGSVVGIDLADGRVREANERSGELADRLRYEVADANRGDYGLASYDVLFAKAALHHIAELESMMQGMRRALRPGGRLVIYTPNLASLGHRVFQRHWLHLDPPRHLCGTVRQRPKNLRCGPDQPALWRQGRQGRTEELCL